MAFETSAGSDLRNEKENSMLRDRRLATSQYQRVREIQPIAHQQNLDNVVGEDRRPGDETISPNRAYRFNNNIDWSRASFKVKKPKPGKVKYLSKAEIWSLGLSFLLSLVMAGLLVFVSIYLTPIVTKNFSNFIEDVGILSNAMSGKIEANQRKGVWSSIPLIPLHQEASEGFTKSLSRRKTPAIFNISSSSIIDSCVANINNAQDARQTCNQSEFFDLLFNDSSITTTFSSADMKLSTHSHPFSSLFKISQTRTIYQVSGNQQWILFRHDQIPIGGFDPMKPIAELLELYPANFKECRHVWQGELHADQALFIPEGWYAASIAVSTENSISITLTAAASEQSSFMYYWSIGQQRMIAGDYIGAIKMFKLGLGIARNLMLLESMADTLSANQQFLAAEEFYRECITLNPRNPMTYSKLINLLINHATKDVSTNIAELLDQASAVGLREKVLELSHNEL